LYAVNKSTLNLHIKNIFSHFKIRHRFNRSCVHFHYLRTHFFHTRFSKSKCSVNLGSLGRSVELRRHRNSSLFFLFIWKNSI